MVSRDLKSEEKEKYPELLEHQVAIDGIAIITNKTTRSLP
jgi:ABC-type phosphate transport system substrate-binding protein